jgi:hypothetical protein
VRSLPRFFAVAPSCSPLSPGRATAPGLSRLTRHARLPPLGMLSCTERLGRGPPARPSGPRRVGRDPYRSGCHRPGQETALAEDPGRASHRRPRRPLGRPRGSHPRIARQDLPPRPVQSRLRIARNPRPPRASPRTRRRPRRPGLTAPPPRPLVSKAPGGLLEAPARDAESVRDRDGAQPGRTSGSRQLAKVRDRPNGCTAPGRHGNF